MGVISKLKSLFTKSTTLLDTPDKIAKALEAYQTTTGESVSTQRAMQMATVFSCVRVLAESLGMLPCKLYETDEKSRKIATSHPVNRLLSVAPNTYMTPQEFWELLMACLCFRGNFYAYKVVVMGKIKELLPIDPCKVKPKLTDDWELVYEVDFGKSGRRTLKQDEIWHVRLFTLDGINGVSPIAYAREAISLGLNTQEHGTRTFANGAVTTGVLATDQELTDVAYDRLKKDFSGEHMGVANAHKPMILEMGLNWKPISLNAEDAQHLETRKFQREEICAFMRVPPTKVAILDKATLNNSEVMELDFVKNSLMPYVTRIEARILIGLLTEEEQTRYYAKFNAGALLRGDLKSRYESYAIAINWGILSPNDCLELEDRNPRPGGDIYLTPMNMTTNPGAQNANKAAA
ncbi:MAG TPA: phage portal protein [Cellvibrionaceae bacterium]